MKENYGCVHCEKCGQSFSVDWVDWIGTERFYCHQCVKEHNEKEYEK